jgi:hypothetical protein
VCGNCFFNFAARSQLCVRSPMPLLFLYFVPDELNFTSLRLVRLIAKLVLQFISCPRVNYLIAAPFILRSFGNNFKCTAKLLLSSLN